MACWERLLPSARYSFYSTTTIIRSLVGIQTSGECDYADIEKFRDDFLFRELARRACGLRSQYSAMVSSRGFRVCLHAFGPALHPRGRHFAACAVVLQLPHETENAEWLLLFNLMHFISIITNII